MKNYTYYIYSLIAGFILLFSANAGAQTWNFSLGAGAADGNYNSVSLNTNKNQMRLTLSDASLKYYNTEDVSVSIDNNAGVVTVTPLAGAWEDVYTQTVKDISFAKAEATGGEGDIKNNGIVITEAKGWQESVYVKWNLYSGANSYNVYVKGGQYADYTKVDYQLVRNYGNYGRADVVGLMAGTYAVKVVPVAEDTEMADAASEAVNITVKNYDRAGFAHKNWNGGVGAYKDDGTLKSGAKVLYITKNNFNTVQMDMVINSKGGTETRTGLGKILNAKQKGYDKTPLAVRIIGEITDKDADASQRMSDQSGLQLKGNDTQIDMAVTVEGIGEDAIFNGFGFGLVSGCDIEVRNMAFMLQGSSDDNMEVKGSEHIWIHNNDYFYGQKGGGDHGKGDGSLDAKDNCSYATFSYNRFHDSGKSILCGMKSEATTNMITYHHNWFDHSDSRHPRVRTSTVHVWNNYYDGVSKYGVGATSGASVFVEANYFRGTKRPMMSSLQGTDATGDGTFSGENGGMIKSFGNYFDRSVASFSYYTQNNPHPTTGYDAYETSTRDEQVPSSEVTKVGSTSYNNFDTDASKMYEYTPDAAEDVPSIVTGYYGAGRLNHGDIQYTIPNSDDSQYVRISELDAILSAYRSSLVGIFDGKNNDGGSTGGGTGDNTGGDVTPVEGAVTCNFEGKAPSNSAFTVIGNYATNKGTATVDGTTYTTCVKMESATKITFATAQKMNITLYMGSSDTKCNIKVDGTAVDGDTATHTITTTIEAGSHELTKKDSCNLFFIKLVPVE